VGHSLSLLIDIQTLAPLRRGFFSALAGCATNRRPLGRHSDETQLKLFFAFDETAFVERIFLST
jgi:hypothetical protein